MLTVCCPTDGCCAGLHTVVFALLASALFALALSEHSFKGHCHDNRLQATHAAQRGVAAIHETSEHLLDRARDVSDRTSSYVRHEPIKALLLAAAAGATLVAALSVLLRANSR